MRPSLTELFHLSHLLQMLNDHRLAGVEFGDNFLCSCKRISFNDCSQVTVNFQWLAAALLTFKAPISFVELLEPPLHYTLLSSSWAKCIVASCLCYLIAHFELE